MPSNGHGDDFTSSVEIRCDVEYGPVFGCAESDIHRQLEAICRNGSGGDTVSGFAVFKFKRRELSTADVDLLGAKIDDTNVDLVERKRCEGILKKLRHSPLAANERAIRAHVTSVGDPTDQIFLSEPDRQVER